MNLSKHICSKKVDLSLEVPLVIAEAGVNHEGSMETAKKLVDEAAEGGAQAIKFQSYKAATLASKDSPAYWDLNEEPTSSQYELFKKHDSFWKKEFEELKTYCDQVGIEFISTPFDVESANFLNDLMDVFKISSSDITNKPFIEIICDFNKPIVLSTGAAYLSEIHEAVQWIEAKGNPLALLHCVLNYPTPDELANLGGINLLKQQFPQHTVGYSDHTLPADMKTSEVALVLGATIVEKHFTHDKSLPGNDHYHAMNREDLKVFMESAKRICSLVGTGNFSDLSTQKSARENARRSLVSARDIAAGATITREDLTFKRPASGISPKDIDQVVGSKATQDLENDTVITHACFTKDTTSK
ncbi:sialic acid synthase [Rhodopirellula europaea SH398]|uniref:Sialic acid synthase n=2 Tax=Rhodopirellula TaxID=265488 RepID=M5RZY4_9BACT|nr:sialic acid synthase [Rhodopirellula europaea SH398]